LKHQVRYHHKIRYHGPSSTFYRQYQYHAKKIHGKELMLHW